MHLVLATSGPWHILSFIGIIFIISYQVLSLIWGQIAISYNYIRLQRWERNLIAEDIDGDDVISLDTKNDKGRWKLTIFFLMKEASNRIFGPMTEKLSGVKHFLVELCLA